MTGREVPYHDPDAIEAHESWNTWPKNYANRQEIWYNKG
jgi:hypothetical protein